MTDVLKITADCVNRIKEEKIQPDIFVVLNMVDINEAKLDDPFKDLNINIKGIIKFPYAFESKEVHGDIKVNDPNQGFCKIASDFKSKLLNQHKNSELKEFTLKKWFKFSEVLWDKAEKLKSLFNYENLEELQQVPKISKIIDEFIDKFKMLMSDNQDPEFKINQIFIEKTKNFDINDYETILHSINVEISNESHKFIENSLKQLDSICKDKNISQNYFIKYKEVLESKLLQTLEDWKQIATKKMVAKKVLFSKVHFEDLNKEIENLKSKNVDYSTDSATQKFHEWWDNFIEKPQLDKIKNLKF